MAPRLRVFSVLIATLFLIPALTLYRDLTKRSDIWWTPLGMALSLPDSKDRVEIYVGAQSLGTLLEQKRVSITDESASRALGASEIRLRFNNWDRVRAARIPALLAYAAVCGAGIMLLVLLATGRLAYRGERKAEE